jgi:hypothetical protein
MAYGGNYAVAELREVSTLGFEEVKAAVQAVLAVVRETLGMGGNKIGLMRTLSAYIFSSRRVK